MSVVIETTVGDFTIDLFTEERPRSSLNFLKLCKQKYYNLNMMFSVEHNFVAQMGDPTNSGRGGSSVFSSLFGEQARLFEGEKLPLMTHGKIGTVSLVAYGEHMYGSQFIVTLGDNLDSLDSEHLVIGEVTEGLDVVAKLNDVLTDEKHRPYQDIRITHTVVLDDPFPDPENFQYPNESPRPTPEMLASDYIAVHETIDDTEDKDISQIKEEIEAKEAEARATILEMVGDIPDADMAPPENVLFVCKLNPVTTSEDLEIIFSRFGKINCAEVIKDSLTGNSLQYAFIEFDDKKCCEAAYFKMDNVLIDDRRIHVDFSQSVSKIKWRGRGRGVNLFDDKGKKMNNQSNRNNQEVRKNSDEKRSRFINPEEYSKRYKDQHDEGDKPVSFRNVDKKFNENRHYRNREDDNRNERHNQNSRHRRDEDNDRHGGRRRDESNGRINRNDDRRINDRKDDFRRHNDSRRYNDREHNDNRRHNDWNDNRRHNNWNDNRRHDGPNDRNGRQMRGNPRDDRDEQNDRAVEEQEPPADIENKILNHKDKRQKLMEKLRDDLKRKKSNDSDDSSDSSPERKKKKKKHKKAKESDSSDSSESDSDRKAKKKKAKKTKKSKKKKSKKSKH